jgi:PrgI family protein
VATYKVIQDIEAEDKLVGPLTLRQFIYAGIAALCLYICFLGLTKHFPYIMAIFLPVAFIAGFFAFPWGRDQPTETWALAKIRFLFKPRLRIWDQSGVKQLVSITVPRQVAVDYTNGLTQTEVSSRLKALADTIDSRGWAVKNVNVNLYSQPSQLATETASDRLIDPSSLPQQVPTFDVTASDDIMDETASPVAQHLEQMIEASEQAHRKQVEQALQPGNQNASATTSPPNDYWFMNQPSGSTTVATPGYATFKNSQVIAPGSTDDDLPIQPAQATPEEEALAAKIHAEAERAEPAYSHMRTILPLADQKAASAASQRAAASVTQPADPAILGLANNNDRSVASIAREANETHGQEPPEDEIVISLH